MVPSYERETKGVHLMSICKKKLHDPDDTFYYGQVSKQCVKVSSVIFYICNIFRPGWKWWYMVSGLDPSI